MARLPFDNGGLKFIVGLFLTSLLVPLLAVAYSYGSLSSKVDNMQAIYATEVEAEKIRGEIEVVKTILQNAPWYTKEVNARVDDLQRQINERIRLRASGYASSQEKNISPGQP